MRAVMLEAPKGLLEERRRLGHDRRDELWEGVLHMVPPPSRWHQRFGFTLGRNLASVAEPNGLLGYQETGIFADTDDYRIPDLAFASERHNSERGLEGAELVIEILSPNDESRDKLGFYAGVGVTEVWLIDPDTRAFEIYVLRGGAYHAALPGDDGAVRSPALGVTLATVDGPGLELRWPDGSTEI